jgi:CheY-like chemotaxis protein
MDAIGQLAGGIAHDFNNLLTVIIGRGQILRDRLKGEANQRAVTLITSTAERAASLTQRLLAFSRKQVLQPRVLDLSVVVSGLASMLQRLIGEHITLVTLGDRPLGRVSADPSQIEQVILNLVVNARDAMPNGGTVTIETRNVEGRHPGVMLIVRDTGCGMDAETRSRMFEPFFTTKEPGQGTGLGLATVYGIVKQHEGTIDVESAPNHGTTLRITLPRVAAAEVNGDVRVRPQGRPSGYETILLVDDDEGVRQLARDILRMNRYRVLEAATPLHALALAEAHTGVIDLLVTDVVMPAMSGRELAGRLSQLRPGTRILYTSGYPGQTIASHGVLDGHAALLRKPFTVDSLIAAVRETLDRPSREPVLEPVG